MRAFAICGHQCLGHGIAPLLLQVEEAGEYLGSKGWCQQFLQLSPKFRMMDLYQAALAYTARYATSKENLRRVLWRKLQRAAYRDDGPPPPEAASEAEISRIINHLENIGAVDDRSYAQSQLRTLKARGTSARAIRAKLQAKGVPARLIADLLAESSTGDSERQAAIRYAQRRRLGPYRKSALSPEQRQKDLAALCRAGFAYATAISVFDGGHGDRDSLPEWSDDPA
jgi:regulatory protein